MDIKYIPRYSNKTRRAREGVLPACLDCRRGLPRRASLKVYCSMTFGPSFCSPFVCYPLNWSSFGFSKATKIKVRVYCSQCWERLRVPWHAMGPAWQPRCAPLLREAMRPGHETPKHRASQGASMKTSRAEERGGEGIVRPRKSIFSSDRRERLAPFSDFVNRQRAENRQDCLL